MIGNILGNVVGFLLMLGVPLAACIYYLWKRDGQNLDVFCGDSVLYGVPASDPDSALTVRREKMGVADASSLHEPGALLWVSGIDGGAF